MQNLQISKATHFILWRTLRSLNLQISNRPVKSLFSIYTFGGMNNLQLLLEKF